MATITRADVTALFGQLDDHFLAEILATGATPQEFLEAISWINNDEPLLNTGRPLASGRVARIVDILERADGDLPAAGFQDRD